MALSLGINRDLQVSFDLSEVKKAIDSVCASSKAKYQIEKKDDNLNYYSIALIGGLAVIVPVNITLKKISETETQITISSEKATYSGNQANDIVDKFLSKISASLSGEEINETSNSSSNKGCLGSLFLMLIVFTVSVTLLIIVA
ncbi:MAG: hypothetical protein ACK41Z_04300 [Sediminibacterium sp.]